MKEKWQNFSEEEIKDIILNSKTFKEASQKFGYSGNNKSINDKIRKIAKERNLTTPYLTKELPKKGIDYVGTVVNFLQILYIDKDLTEKNGYTTFACKCLRCGKEPHYVQISCIKKTQSCGCLKTERFIQNRYKDLSGQSFQSLKVLELDKEESLKRDKFYWKCQCLRCGNITSVRGWDLKANKKDNCGCYNRKSKGEEKINKILNSLFFDFKQEYSFKDFYTTKGHPYRFDFAIFRDSKLVCLIEYNGKQHYENGWKDKESLEDIQKRDNIKAEYCKKNSIPLIIIPYTDFNKIDNNYILEKINEVI